MKTSQEVVILIACKRGSYDSVSARKEQYLGLEHLRSNKEMVLNKHFPIRPLKFSLSLSERKD